MRSCRVMAMDRKRLFVKGGLFAPLRRLKPGASSDLVPRFPSFWSLALFFGSLQTANALIPLFVGGYIDAIAGRAGLRTTFVAFACLVAALAYSSTANPWFNLLLKRATHAFEMAVQFALFTRLRSMSPHTLEEQGSGEVCAKFLRDAPQLAQFGDVVITVFISGFISAIVSFGIAASRNGYVAVFLLVFLPCYAGVLIRFRDRMIQSELRLRRSNDGFWDSLISLLDVFAELRTHSAERGFMSAPKRQFVEKRKGISAFDRVAFTYESTLVLLLIVGEGFVLAVTGYLSWHGRMAVGDVVVCQLLFTQTLGAVSQIFKTLPQFELIEGARASIEAFGANDTADENSRPPITELRGQISIRDMTFEYPNGRRIFDRFSFDIEARTFVAITGANGTGKSTLAKLIAGSLSPSDGEICVDGVALSTVRMSSYRQRISIVLQNAQIFPGTVLDNITLKSSCDPTALEALLQRLGLGPVIDRLEEGINTRVGAGGIALSGGERQRIILARALVRRPSILLFDELTNHLDALSVAEVYRVLHDIRGTCTIIAVSHNKQITELADVVLCLDGRHPRPGDPNSSQSRNGTLAVSCPATLRSNRTPKEVSDARRQRDDERSKQETYQQA